MNLIKRQVPYNWTEDGVTEYGDLYNAQIEDLFNSRFDCDLTRCYHCYNLLAPNEKIVIYKANDGDTYVVCQNCAKQLFDCL